MVKKFVTNNSNTQHTLTIYDTQTNTTIAGFTIGAGRAGWGIAVSGYPAAAGFGVVAQKTATEIAEYQATALTRYTNVKNESTIYF